MGVRICRLQNTMRGEGVYVGMEYRFGVRKADVLDNTVCEEDESGQNDN